MSELTYTEQKLVDKVSKCDLPTLQKMLPEIKEAAKKTGDQSLAPVIQSERVLSSMNQNHGLSKDQIGYMAVDKEINDIGKKSPELSKLMNPLRYSLGLANINLEFNPNPGKSEELISNLKKSSLYLMASPFLTERIASLITNYSKESSNSVAQKEKMDKQIYKNMDMYVNRLMQNNYAMLSPMLLKTIMDRTIREKLDEEINAIKKDIVVAEKEGKKMEAKKAKNELEFLMRLENPEGLPYIYLQLIAQRIMVPPKHVKLKLKDTPEPGKLMQAVKDVKFGFRATLGPVLKHIKSNEKTIVKDLTEAMERFRQA
jgi:hypothetical protein